MVCIFLVLIGIVALVGTQRSGDVRRHAVAGHAGRQAEQIARSAIEEALATLTPDTLFGSGKMNAQGQFEASFLTELDADGLIERDDVGNPVRLKFPASLVLEVKPEAIIRMYEPDRTIKRIDPVKVRPLSFSSANWGVVQLQATVVVEAGAQTATRIVTEERQVAFDPALPNRLRIDRASLRSLVQRTATVAEDIHYTVTDH
jgi:hypothetical protein